MSIYVTEMKKKKKNKKVNITAEKNNILAESHLTIQPV